MNPKEIIRRLAERGLVCFMGLLLVIGCGGGGGGSDSANNSSSDSTYDASGEWTLSMTPDEDSLESNTTCEMDTPWVETVSLDQNGSSIVITNEDGDVFQGSVDGKKYTYSGSYNDSDSGDPITISGTFTLSDKDSLAGKHTIKVESGNLYCQYLVDYTGKKHDTTASNQDTIDTDLFGWWLEYDSDFSVFRGDGIVALSNGNVYDLDCYESGLFAEEDCDWEIDWWDLEYKINSAGNGSVTYIDKELGGTHTGAYYIDGNKLTLSNDTGVTRYYKRYESGTNFDQAGSDDDQDGYTENQGDCNDEDDTIYPGADEICGDLVDQDCDAEDLECSVSTNCCECKWTCFFMNEYGSGTATSTATIKTTGSFTSCQNECWDEASSPSSDCVSNIDIVYARPCE